MNSIKFNSPFFVVGAVVVFLLLLLSKGQLVMNEEFLLIVNFFLLIGFFYQYVAELKGFLNSRQELIKYEAHRVLSMHRHNATRLKEAYRAKRFMSQIVISSSVRLHQLYRSYRNQVLPQLLPFYVNSSFVLVLETIYNEELQLLRSIYVVKALLIKNRLIGLVTSQLDVATSLERSLTVLESK